MSLEEERLLLYGVSSHTWHTLFMEAALGLPVSSWTCFDSMVLMEQRVLEALEPHRLIKTQRDGPWQKNQTSA